MNKETILTSAFRVHLSKFFEHPARGSPVVLDVPTIEFPPCHNSFSADS